MFIMPQARVADVRQLLKNQLAKEEFVIDKTGVKTVELINAAFIADEDIIFGSHNVEYFSRELEWYKSMSRNVNDIPPPIPQIWKMVATPDGRIQSNYGWAIWSKENFSQYDNCLAALKSNPDTRRAVMIYTRPSMQYDYNLDGMSDFMCCVNTTHLIRDNQLITLVYFRSVDAVFGYKNDVLFAKYVADELVKDLLPTYPNLTRGAVVYNISSLHVYSRHFHLLGDAK